MSPHYRGGGIFMSTRPVLLNDLAKLVENAVQQVIQSHGGGPIDKIWFGFVAPESLATQEVATNIATEIGRVSGVHVTPAVATEALLKPAGIQTEALVRPSHIIGL